LKCPYDTGVMLVTFHKNSVSILNVISAFKSRNLQSKRRSVSN